MLHGHAAVDRFCGIAGGPCPPVMIVAAHSDDETIGLGSRLPHLGAALLVHVTDGAPRSMVDARAAGFESRAAYAEARSSECEAALAVAGSRCVRSTLGCVDQEASYYLADAARRLAASINTFQPTLVLSHPYEGGHPDHDAAAFAVHAACRLLRERGRPVPQIVEFTSYHNAGGRLRTGEFLPNGSGPVWTVLLDGDERTRKQRMIDCHRTQRVVLRQFPVACERFRLAPEYDFTAAPHPGRLYYELFDWGMTGERWRRLACGAAAERWAAEPICR